MIVVLMGVSGSGKTTVGTILAAKLGWPFAEGDDFHPIANIDKMRNGSPLTDEDRLPWLEALRAYIDQFCERGESLVVACSALNRKYREYLNANCRREVQYVFLDGDEQLIGERLANREGHFMPPTLLASQFETLEPPVNAIRVDTAAAPAVVATRIIDALKPGLHLK